MRVFALSDVHVDFGENLQWISDLSSHEYNEDILILAGDVTHDIKSLESVFEILCRRFALVLYVPGNHDLWVNRKNGVDSLGKYQLIKEITDRTSVRMEPFHYGPLSIVPLLGWYDYSFGKPDEEILTSWFDFIACKWPSGFDEEAITRNFTDQNESFLEVENEYIISFSHFLPRIDLMPSFIPPSQRILYPVLGSTLIEKQIRRLGSDIHVYGHSHLNMSVYKDDTLYINNAFGYPYEKRIAAKELKCVYEL